MNPIIPVQLYYAFLVLIMLANIFTSIMYLLDKNIKVIRIIVSSISLVFYLAQIIKFYHFYFAWICAGICLVLLLLDIFLKPLNHE